MGGIQSACDLVKAAKVERGYLPKRDRSCRFAPGLTAGMAFGMPLLGREAFLFTPRAGEGRRVIRAAPSDVCGGI